jgi:hypothetical protein
LDPGVQQAGVCADCGGTGRYVGLHDVTALPELRREWCALMLSRIRFCRSSGHFPAAALALGKQHFIWQAGSDPAGGVSTVWSGNVSRIGRGNVSTNTPSTGNVSTSQVASYVIDKRVR